SILVASHASPIEATGQYLPEGECVLCIRPEHIEIDPYEEGNGRPAAIVRGLTFKGQLVRADITTEDGFLLFVDKWSADWDATQISVGDKVCWSIKPGRALAFPADGR